MNSCAVDRDLFQEVENENVNLLGGGGKGKEKYEELIPKKWWFRLLLSLEIFLSQQFISPLLKMSYRSRHFLRYNLREIFKRRVGYCLGMLSCVLVVLAVTTTVTVTDQLPIIFLRIGENTVGQYDLVVWSDIDVGHTINYTHMEDGLKRDSISDEHQELFSMTTPRISMDITIYQYEGCSKQIDTGEKFPIWDSSKMQWMYGYDDYDTECTGNNNERLECPKIKCGKKNAGSLIAYDHDREEKMGLGRDWEHERLKAGECIISADLADDLNVKVGDDLIIETTLVRGANLGWLEESGFMEIGEGEAGPDVDINWYYYNQQKNYRAYFPLKIVALETTFKGKNDHDSYGSDVVFVDYESLFSHIGRYIDQEFANIRPLLMTSNPYDFAMEVYLNHPKRVTKLYNTNNFRAVRNSVTHFTGQFLYLAGFDQLESGYPLLYFLQGTRFIGLFLSLIINIIITILVGLSVILIYSLLMINVEERTFEMGVLRMVGLKLHGLVEMILMQSLLYSIPGIFLGLIVGQLLYIVLALILQYYLKASIPFSISAKSILIAIALGLVIPLAGSIIPIRKAMGKSLNESLDTRRSKTKAVKVKIERLSDSKVSWSVIILSTGSFGFGFFIYYFFPLAMITQQFELLLLLFFGIILMMLVGCVLLSLNLEGIIQNVLTRVIFFWEYASVKKLIMKNLVAHKSRNRKTTIMYSISLGFLIFIAVSTRLEIRMYEFANYRIFGTELVIDLPQGREEIADLNKPAFLAELDGFVDTEDILEDYAYVSVPISNVVNYTRFYISTVGGYWWESTDFQAMSPNYFEVMDRDFLIISDQKKEYQGWGVSEQLYSAQASMGFMGGKGEHKSMGTSGSLDKNLVFVMEKPTELYMKYTYELMRYDSVLESGAGTMFSKYEEAMPEPRLEFGKMGHDGYISFPSFLRLLEHENVTTRVEDIPLRHIYLKTNQDYDKKKRRELIKDLKFKIKKSFRRHNMYAEIVDVNELLDRIKVIDNVLSVFFYLSTVLAMTMCFFSLISNMVTNVQEQSKEIGILRAVGCRKCTLRRIYVYEALILIYTSGVIGTVIGMFIGYTLVLQQQLFTQLPLGFVVPYEIIIIVVATGIVCGFLSSICPINILLRSNPVMIMRKVF